MGKLGEKNMRHFLEIRPHSARLACGPTINAYFPMESKALDPSGIGKIDVTLREEYATCPRCIAELNRITPSQRSDG